MTIATSTTPVSLASSRIVNSTIESLNHIATLPEVTLRIMELVESSKSTAQDLHRVISCDPAMCSRILKVVNSAFYGLPRQIGSINRAVVLLGLNAVKNIAIAASLAKLFRGGDLGPNFSARSLWTHSLATAAGSRLIAGRIQPCVCDEAFLAGLIHDIGLMVELQSSRQKLTQVLEQITFNADGAPHADMRKIEQDVFGADHQEFGRGLCDAWKFPRGLGLVAGHHHDPLRAPETERKLVSIVHVADRLAGRAGFGFRGDLVTLSIDPDVLVALRLSDDMLQSVLADLPDAVSEVEATFTSAMAA